MKICVLASGSKGNSTYIETSQNKILIDIGTSLKNITDKLKEISVNIADIDTILITHSHKDHIGALKTLIKKYNPKIYITYGMLSEIVELKAYSKAVIYESDIEINNIYINSIKTSHDTKDSRGFIFTENEKSIVYITDTGYLNLKLLPILKNKEMYLMESNHDIEMLINGKYKDWLKRRVIGPYGHLSNKDSSIYLSKLIGNKTKQVVLMHLSEENNTEEIALSCLENTLKEESCNFNNYICAKQKTRSEVYEI